MKKRTSGLAVALAAVCALLSTQALASDPSEGGPGPEPDPLEVLAGLEEKMSDVSTVMAEFVQEKELAVLEHTMIIRGRMALEGPDNIAWHVDEPVRYRMVIRGSRLRQWDEDTDRVQKFDLDQHPAYRAMFQQLTSWFSGEYERLLERYTLEIAGSEPVVLIFTPKPDTLFADVLSRVTIVFEDDQRYIKKLKIRELNESLSTIRFHETRLDDEIEEGMWRARPSD